jgi:myo-inositol-1(or 4)-monophosphatase
MFNHGMAVVCFVACSPRLTVTVIMNNHHLLAVAVEAAKLGGEVLRAHWNEARPRRIEAKSEFDFVTNVDHESEAVIVAHLQKRFPEHKILAEESGARGAASATVEWIIDPLDGTANYMHGVPNFAASIAARQHGEVLCGVVYDPLREELFAASKGEGAFLNGKRLQVTATASLHDCLIATGFPFRMKELSASYLKMFAAFFAHVRDLRRLGAASLDLAYVAAGRFSGYWEYRLNPWDFAAGVLLVHEAGGLVTGFTAADDYWSTGNILASNSLVHAQMEKLVRAGL